MLLFSSLSASSVQAAIAAVQTLYQVITQTDALFYKN